MTLTAGQTQLLLMSATLMGHGELVAYVVSQGRGGGGNGRKAGRVGMEMGGGGGGSGDIGEQPKRCPSPPKRTL